MPAGHIALHLEPTSQLQSDMEERSWQAKQTFEAMTLWKLENTPHHTDPLFAWTRAVQVADAVSRVRLGLLQDPS
eukprot:m.155034 g.155034  ORF g.155034 m.155034 type:complete len:75 (-) comp16265_c1_seq9:81-305(-)